MRFIEVTALIGLSALWGASFLFIRVASPIFGPFLTIEGRVVLAAIALLLYLLLTNKSLQFKLRWKEYFIIGALNAAIPFTLIATASLHLSASMSSILNSLTPLFTALVVWRWLKESMGLKKWFGIIIGVMGVILLVGWSSIPYSNDTVIAICLAIMSTISYGFAGVYAKKTFSGVPPLSLATGQQIGAAILLIPFTLLNLPSDTSKITIEAVLSVIGLALLCTAVAYLLYFYLIENVGPTKTLSVTFLIPVFGMIWGGLILHEQISASMLIGFIIILIGVFLLSDLRLSTHPFKKRMEI